MRAILSIAKTTVGEAVRRRVLLVILLVGLMFVLVAPGLSILTARQSTVVLKSLTLAVIQLTAAVIAVVLTVYMIPNEIDRRTIYTILCKPVQRWQFLIGKYLGAVAALAMMIGFMSIVLVLTFVLSQGEKNPQALAELIVPPIMNFFQMSLLAALAMFFSTFVTPLVNIFLSSGIYVVGTIFSPFFQSLRDSSASPAIKTMASTLQSILPNFSLFNVQNAVINPGQSLTSAGVLNFGNILYGLMYIGGLLIAAIMVFDRREM